MRVKLCLSAFTNTFKNQQELDGKKNIYFLKCSFFLNLILDDISVKIELGC